MHEFDYICPHCKKLLNKKDQLMFSVKTSMGVESKITLSPRVGNYNYILKPKIQLNQGELVDFFCPFCNANLVSPKNADYVEINLVVNELISFDVVFSRKAGERRTYVITEEYIEKHGDNPPDFKNIFSGPAKK